MKRSYVHLLVDMVLGLAGLALLSTGLLLAIVLPAHSRQASVWGLTRHDWGEVHLWIALLMLAVLLLHLALNWGWVCSVVGKMLGNAKRLQVGWRKQATGAVALAVVVGAVVGFLWLASLVRVPDPGPQRLGGGQGWRQVDRP